jgi:hypothetical protein
MAVYICRIHGRTGAVTVCSHIAKNVSEKKKLPKLIIASFYFGDFAGNPDAPIIEKLGYCPICVEKYGFPAESRELSENEFEDMSEKDFKGVCVECFSKLKEIKF